MKTRETGTARPAGTPPIDPVERAGLDSFPASDPPAWIASEPGAPDSCPLDAAPKLTDINARLARPS